MPVLRSLNLIVDKIYQLAYLNSKIKTMPKGASIELNAC